MNDELAKEIRRFNVLMEDQNGKLDAILEGQKDQATRTDIHRLEDRLDVLESSVNTIRAAVGDLSNDLAEHRKQSGYARPGGHVERSRWP